MLRFFALLITLALSPPAFSNSIQSIRQALDSDRHDQAIQAGLALLRTQPGNTEARFLTALAFQKNGQKEIAARHYRELIQRQPGLPEPRNNLAMIYMDQGKYDEAIDVLVATLNTHPAYATAWKNLKMLYQGLASEAYRKALSKEKNPRSVMDKIQLTALTRLYPPPAKPLPRLNQSSTQSDAQAIDKKMLSAASPPARSAKNTPRITVHSAVATRQELAARVKQWAQAWSSKDFKSYVDAYLPGYKDGKRSHRAWLDYRRSRIIRPGFIRVEVDRFKLKSVSGQRAIIDFRQRFSSPNYKDSVIKRLYLSKTSAGWKISREKTLSVL